MELYKLHIAPEGCNCPVYGLNQTMSQSTALLGGYLAGRGILHHASRLYKRSKEGAIIKGHMNFKQAPKVRCDKLTALYKGMYHFAHNSRVLGMPDRCRVGQQSNYRCDNIIIPWQVWFKVLQKTM